MINIRNKWFTGLEIVISLMIVLILSAVWYMTYNWYTNSLDNAKVITNLSKIENKLEAYNLKNWFYPEPENSFEIRYLWDLLWKQWTLWKKTKKEINITDKKLLSDREIYDYSVTWDWQNYQVASIIEDFDWSTSFFYAETFAKSDVRANVVWNYNGTFLRVELGWRIKILSFPSILLNKKWDINLTKWISSDLFIVDKWSSLSANYWEKEFTWTWFTFTPRELYKGYRCWVSSDREIINFLWELRDSYNTDFFKWKEEFSEVLDDYDSLSEDILDFSLISDIWIKINNNLWCNIKKFERTEIFPIEIWNEDLTFEWVPDDFNINNSNILTYEWDGSALVKSWSWTWPVWDQWIELSVPSWVWRIQYRIFTYIPTKFSFDLKSDLTGTSKFRFLMNDIEYHRLDNYWINWTWTNLYNNGFIKYETPLLEPWIYEFEFEVEKWSWNSKVWLDNFEFPCKLWVNDVENYFCWWDLSFENNNIHPEELFDFTWLVRTPWPRSDSFYEPWETSHWDFQGLDYSIRVPNIDNGNTTALEYPVTFTQPGKFTFDIRAKFNHDSNYVKFYIQDVGRGWWSANYVEYRRSTPSHNMPFIVDGSYDNFDYISPLLPAWNYIFKWVYYKHWWEITDINIDNIHIICWGWPGTNCWRDGWIEDSWDIPYSPKFTYWWVGVTPWGRNYDAWWEVKTWTYAIQAPLLEDWDYTYMDYHVNIWTPKKINFDLKWYFYSKSSYVKFYIRDVTNTWTFVPYVHYSNWETEADTSDNRNYKEPLATDNSYKHFESPLLPAWKYTFRWRVYRHYWKTDVKIDNIWWTCEWWLWTDCWWWDWFEEWIIFNPSESVLDNWLTWFKAWIESDVSEKSWLIFGNTPWNVIDKVQYWTWEVKSWTYAIQAPIIEDDQRAVLDYHVNIWVPKKISFDLKWYFYAAGSYAKFYIKDVTNSWTFQPYVYYTRSDIADHSIEGYRQYKEPLATNNTYKHFESPLLPAWEYIFRWELKRDYSRTDVKIDNIEWACEWWLWTDCWWWDWFEKWNIFDPSESVLNSWTTWFKTWIEEKVGSWFIYWHTPWNVIDKSVYWAWEVKSWTYAIQAPILEQNQRAVMDYHVNIWTPRKIAFDLKWYFYAADSYAKFYIKDVTNSWTFQPYVYYTNPNVVNNNSTYKHYKEPLATANEYKHFESPLLPAWEYIFRWEVKRDSYRTDVKIDNIEWTCEWWLWTDCWWWDWFEKWNIFDPSESVLNSWTTWFKTWIEEKVGSWFTFGNTPWNVIHKDVYWVWEVESWTYAIQSPILKPNQRAVMDYYVDLLTPRKIAFDLKPYFRHTWAYAKFYIKDVTNSWSFEHKLTFTKSDNNVYKRYESLLLSEWRYAFRWEVKRDLYRTDVKIDNLEWTCIWWTDCWWWPWFEAWDLIYPADEITFTWSLSTPWNLTTEASYVDEWLYALKVPLLGDWEKSIMDYKKTIDAGWWRLSFDIKANFTHPHSYAKFYIRNEDSWWFVEQWYYTNSSAWNLNNLPIVASTYKHFDTSLLPSWTYTFRWEVFNDSGTTEVWIDWLKWSCLWWGASCWWWEWFELWNIINPWTELSFAWDNPVPWALNSQAWTMFEWTYSLHAPHLDDWEKAIMSYHKNLTATWKLNFAIKADLFHTGSYVKFYIKNINDWLWYVEQAYFINSDWVLLNENNLAMVADNTYKIFVTSLLPVWNYIFKWEVYKEDHRVDVKIDRLKWTCSSWEANCLWDLWFEWWNDINPWSDLSFTWVSTVPWNDVSWSWQAKTWWYALQAPYLWNGEKAIMKYPVSITWSWMDFTFDMKLDIYNTGSYIYFWVYDVFSWTIVENTMYNGWDLTNSTYYTKPSIPLTSWKDYELIWEVYKNIDRVDVLLDNLKFTTN